MSIWNPNMIRTCFQSLSYRSLELDSRHNPMATAKDMIDNEFVLLLGAEESLEDDTFFG